MEFVVALEFFDDLELTDGMIHWEVVAEMKEFVADDIYGLSDTSEEADVC